MSESYQYRAFISYSRADRVWAKILQTRLERYVLPQTLRMVKPGLKHDARPLKPIFRDEDELVPGQDLPERIRVGLKKSEFLIVVCSPHALSSIWVEKEIIDFIALGGRQRILAVVVDGEPNATRYGLDPALECLPAPLRFQVDVRNDDTGIDVAELSDRPTEPLWVDWRKGIDRNRPMFLRLVAALLSLSSLDELVRRDRNHRRRRQFLYATAITLITTFATIGLQQWERATSRQLAMRSMQEIGSGSGVALRDAISAAERAHTDAAELALNTALGTDSQRSFDGMIFQKAALRSAQFSPDGSRIVTASEDKTACIFDAAHNRLLATLAGHTDTVNSAVFSLDGKHIVTSSEDHTARVWSAADGSLLATLTGHSDSVLSAFFSPDGKQVLTASKDHKAMIWDAESGRLLFTLGTSHGLRSAVFSPDGKRVVSASEDNTAIIWNANGNVQDTLTGHTDLVASAKFSPDNKHVVTSSNDGTVRIWDAENGNLLYTLMGHTGDVHSAAFSPDGKRIVSASFDATVRVWDASDGKLLLTLTGEASEPFFYAAFSANGKRIATADAGGAKLWDAETGELVAKYADGNASDLFNSARLSPDNKSIVMIDGNEAHVYIADFTELLQRAKKAVQGPECMVGLVVCK